MNLRSTRLRGLLGLLSELLGTFAFRCDDCGHKFHQSVFGLSTIPYAKCPRCFRMDLTTWTESHYRPTFAMKLQLLSGAKRVRCEACRCNFVSYRARRASYVRPGAEPTAEMMTGESER